MLLRTSTRSRSVGMDQDLCQGRVYLVFLRSDGPAPISIRSTRPGHLQEAFPMSRKESVSPVREAVVPSRALAGDSARSIVRWTRRPRAAVDRRMSREERCSIGATRGSGSTEDQGVDPARSAVAVGPRHRHHFLAKVEPVMKGAARASTRHPSGAPRLRGHAVGAARDRFGVQHPTSVVADREAISAWARQLAPPPPHSPQPPRGRRRSRSRWRCCRRSPAAWRRGRAAARRSARSARAAPRGRGSRRGTRRCRRGRRSPPPAARPGTRAAP